MRERELEAEQAHIDRAYERLEHMTAFVAGQHERAIQTGTQIRVDLESGEGGIDAFQWEAGLRVNEAVADRLKLGDYALVFGRMDTVAGETHHLGRIGVRDAERNPLVLDWRAPAAAAFYRATGRDPNGLVRRRHFHCDGRRLLGIEDELFSESGEGPSGPRALLEALGRRRTGKMRDIVSTVQREQDEIIRAPLDGTLVVAGGPGTGKTAVALHRAAYLLFQHRARLGRRGILVVGPNPVFLGYVDQVLPALGESLAELSTVAGLVGLAEVSGRDTDEAARVKGDLCMVDVIDRAVRDRERPPTKDLVIAYDDLALGDLDLRVAASALAPIPRQARERRGTHNDRRPHVEAMVVEVCLHAYRAAVRKRASELALPPGSDLSAPASDVRKRLRASRAVRRLFDRVWPVLTPHELLHDLYGSRALLRSAGADVEALYRRWTVDVTDVDWTEHDLPLLEEALIHLGPPEPRERSENEDEGVEEHGLSFPLFGHIVVDEAQDLSPMQWRVIARRSIRGSMTLVGDAAQTTSPAAASSWGTGREPRVATLTLNYRTPFEIMAVAAHVLRHIDPVASPPESVRHASDAVEFVDAGSDLAGAVARVAAPADGMVAVVCAAEHSQDIAAALPHAVRADRSSLHGDLVIVPARLVKGLEFDTVVVAEPSAILRDTGPNGLYVALTRATRRVVVVHADQLPEMLRPAGSAGSAR